MGLTINGTRIDLDTNMATTAGQTYHFVFTVRDGVGSFGASGMQAA